MGHKYSSRILELAVFLSACCSSAYGQPCEPEWDTSVGNPGVEVEDGYIGALQVFDDGTGEMLYAGGSFSSVADEPGTSLIARWDRDRESWSSLGGGLIDYGFVNATVPFDAGGGPELVVAGVFTGAPGVPGTTNIAKWNGSEWSSLGGNIDRDGIWALTTWDGVGGDRLYVGGRFPTAGGVIANGIAAWDGEQWHSLGDGIAGSFSPYVDHMMVWDDGSGEKLYVGGRFDVMDGLSTPLIARWEGETWEQVGDGLINDNILFGIESMAVYDDGTGPALYVGGYEFHAPGQPLGNVSKWDGQEWTTVGPRHDGRVTSLRTFDDGNGPGLYRTGNAAYDLLYFSRLVDDDWETVGGGVWSDPAPPWPSTYALCAWDDALYVGGSYNLAGGEFPCGCIAAWGCPEEGGQDVTIVVSNTPALAAPGETVHWDVTLTNNESSPVTVDVWWGATGRRKVPPILLAEEVSLPAGIGITREVELRVPIFAPTGVYQVHTAVGGFHVDPWDHDSFTAEVVSPRID